MKKAESRKEKEVETNREGGEGRSRKGVGVCGRAVLFLLPLVLLAGNCSSQSASSETQNVSSETPEQDTSSETQSARSDTTPEQDTSSETPERKPLVFATTTIWDDIVREATCGDELIEVKPLIPLGVDPHAFEASLQDREQLGQAALLVLNGLDLEENLDDTVADLERDGIPTLHLGEALDPELLIEAHADEHEDEHEEHDEEEHDEHEEHEDEHAHDEEDEHEEHEDEEHAHDEEDEHEHEDEHAHDEEDEHEEHEDEEHEHDEEDEHEHEEEHAHDDEEEHEEHEDEHAHDEHVHEGPDPHIWLDPLLVVAALDVLGERLSSQFPELFPDVATNPETCLQQYRDEVLQAHDEISDILSAIPPERRKIISNHHALGYFVGRYDFEVIGYVRGTSTLSEASMAQVAELRDLIRQHSLPAVFSEHTDAPAGTLENLVETLPDVTIVNLYMGTLGPPGSGAETYLGMMRHNAELIAETLRG